MVKKHLKEAAACARAACHAPPRQPSTSLEPLTQPEDIIFKAAPPLPITVIDSDSDQDCNYVGGVNCAQLENE
jgi:hypothetical protein